MREPLKKMLPVKLLPHEMLEKGQLLSAAITKTEKLYERKAHYSKLIKDRIVSAEASVHSLNETIRTGEELREVLCREEVDLFNKKIRIIRLDTYEVHSERDMDAEEKQMALFDAAQASQNLDRMQQEDGAAPAEPAENVIPLLKVPASSQADVRAQAEAAGQTEEQAVAETPEEAEALREARLAEEASEREETAEDDEPEAAPAAKPDDEEGLAF